MFDPFEGLAAVHAASYLRSALESGSVTHAYLMVGPASCGHELLAARFAAALVANDDKEQFDLALSGAHPDVRHLRPASQTGYVVEQIRETVHDATLAPVRSSTKVYVVHDANRMNGASANAFLKTLEEPPESVHIIMLAPAEGSVLQTLRSRCQVLALPAQAGVADGSDEKCSAFAAELIVAIAHGAGNVALLELAQRFVDEANEGVQELKDEHAQQEEQASDFLAASARKDLEKAHKREQSMEQHAQTNALLNACERWLRDCMLICGGAKELSSGTTGENCAAQEAFGFNGSDSADVYVDPAKTHVAAEVGIAGIIKALDAVKTARMRIAHNVTLRLAAEAMLLEIREALCQK